jgi:wyosine [tRNA(Phe)-imidazoG37] synthetase (radical SAM superfamily)
MITKNSDNTFLFNDVVFGPIESRRLGRSLGVNLLPTAIKYCNFNCIYCECGWTKNKQGIGKELVSEEQVINQLDLALQGSFNQNKQIDSITFAGNGEPTIHPGFEQIIKKTVLLRDEKFPKTKISVLTNASMLHRKSVIQGLLLADERLFKLDAGLESTFRIINDSSKGLTLDEITENISKFKGTKTLQTLFLKGQKVDNSTPEELEAWLNRIDFINPNHVAVYSLDRTTPEKNLSALPFSQLQTIASQVQELNISATAY